MTKKTATSRSNAKGTALGPLQLAKRSTSSDSVVSDVGIRESYASMSERMQESIVVSGSLMDKVGVALSSTNPNILRLLVFTKEGLVVAALKANVKFPDAPDVAHEELQKSKVERVCDKQVPNTGVATGSLVSWPYGLRYLIRLDGLGHVSNFHLIVERLRR